MVLNLNTYNILIDGHCRLCKIMEAFKLQREMVEKGLTPDALVYCELINGLCKEDRRQESELLLNEMQEKGLLPSGFTIDRPIDKNF